MIPKTLIVGFSAILVAYLFSQWNDPLGERDHERNVIMAWKRKIVLPTKSFQRLVIGVNANVDLILNGVALLEALKMEPGEKMDKEILHSIEDLKTVFAHYFTKGSAAERAFSSQEIFRQIVETGNGIPNAKYHIGGNGALMAAKISEMFPNVEINFIGPVGPKLLEMMPKSINIPEESHIPNDEVHLIMEYSVGETWGPHTSPVANRFIFSNDESNGKGTMFETFLNHFEEEDVNCDLVLVSGLHLLETQEAEYFSKKLAEIKLGLQKTPEKVPVHLELASMANRELVKQILEEVTPVISSLGLNEQELSFASHAAGGPHENLFLQMSGQPEIYKISDMLLWLLKTYAYSKDHPDRKMTRVHFHSLTYHIVGVVPSAWSNIEAAIAAGTRMAGRQACDTRRLNSDLVSLKIPSKFKLYTGDEEREFNSHNPVLSWELDGFKFAFSPVLVCKNPLKTVGLGDSISATGLMYSEYNADFRN